MDNIKKQTKREVRTAIVQYLSINGYTVYGINNSGVKMKKRFVGVLAVNSNRNRKRIVFIGIKSTGEKPTPNQIEFIDLINSCGDCILAIWADSIDRIKLYFE